MGLLFEVIASWSGFKFQSRTERGAAAMINASVRLRCDESSGMNLTAFGVLVRQLSAFARRTVQCARFYGEAAFHCYCFRVATARHEVGAYGSLSSIPEGIPAGVMVLLAVAIILQTIVTAWIRRCRNDARC
jgi:hypothetical protein